MISIKLYSFPSGDYWGTRDYDYSETTTDATGKVILYPDRMLFSDALNDIIRKDFYLRADGVAIESRFEEKRAFYLKINDLFLSKSEVVQAIENRLVDLKITAIQAKIAYQKVTTGNDAEQFFRTLTLISTANNMVVSNVVNLMNGFSNSRWKTALRNFLEDLEREWAALNQKLDFLTGQNKTVTPTTNQNTESSTAKNTTAAQNAGNSNDTFTIVALVAAVVLIFKKLKKRK